MVKGDDVGLRLMAGKMKTKFEKYWDDLAMFNMLLFIAIVLDRRYKLKYISFCFERMYGDDKGSDLTRRVKLTLNQLYEHYLLQYGNAASVGGVGGAISSNGGTSSAIGIEESEENYSDFIKVQFKFHMIEAESIKSELNTYLAEPCKDGDDSSFDILDWWKMNSTRYHILSSIAKDILAIPVACESACESDFGLSGRIWDPFMSSLSPKVVEALVCTQNWLQLRNTVGDVKEKNSGCCNNEAIRF